MTYNFAIYRWNVNKKKCILEENKMQNTSDESNQHRSDIRFHKRSRLIYREPSDSQYFPEIFQGHRSNNQYHKICRSKFFSFFCLINLANSYPYDRHRSTCRFFFFCKKREKTCHAHTHTQTSVSPLQIHILHERQCYVKCYVIFIWLQLLYTYF